MSNEVKTALVAAAVILAVVYVNNHYLHLERTLAGV